MTSLQTHKTFSQQGDSIFKEYYVEELEKNTLYRHLVAAMRGRPDWTPETWSEALRDVHDYEYECFKNAFYRMREICGKDAPASVKLNEFVLYRSAF